MQGTIISIVCVCVGGGGGGRVLGMRLVIPQAVDDLLDLISSSMCRIFSSSAILSRFSLAL